MQRRTELLSACSPNLLLQPDAAREVAALTTPAKSRSTQTLVAHSCMSTDAPSTEQTRRSSASNVSSPLRPNALSFDVLSVAESFGSDDQATYEVNETSCLFELAGAVVDNDLTEDVEALPQTPKGKMRHMQSSIHRSSGERCETHASAIAEPSKEEQAAAASGGSQSDQCCNSLAQPSTSSGTVQELRTLRIRLQGCGHRQQQRFIQELVASASNVMVTKGFHSVRQGIKIETGKDAGTASSTDLSFPCALSALGFFGLFDEYVWESSNGCQTCVIKLSSQEFHQELSNRAIKLRFANPAVITPTNVSEYFGVELQRES